MKNKKLIIEIIIALLVLLFLHTALSKFIDFRGFKHDLDNQPFPATFTPFLKWFLPISELLIVAMLFFEKTRTIALYASLVLMTAFTIYTALVLFHVFAYVPCSCGGVVRYLSWPQHLVFNLFFVSITAWAIKLRKLPSHYEINYTQ